MRERNARRRRSGCEELHVEALERDEDWWSELADEDSWPMDEPGRARAKGREKATARE